MDVEVRYKPQASHSGECFVWIRLGELTWLYVAADGYSGVKEVQESMRDIWESWSHEWRRL